MMALFVKSTVLLLQHLGVFLFIFSLFTFNIFFFVRDCMCILFHRSTPRAHVTEMILNKSYSTGKGLCSTKDSSQWKEKLMQTSAWIFYPKQGLRKSRIPPTVTQICWRKTAHKSHCVFVSRSDLGGKLHHTKKACQLRKHLNLAVKMKQCENNAVWLYYAVSPWLGGGFSPFFKKKSNLCFLRDYSLLLLHNKTHVWHRF